MAKRTKIATLKKKRTKSKPLCWVDRKGNVRHRKGGRKKGKGSVLVKGAVDKEHLKARRAGKIVLYLKGKVGKKLSVWKVKNGVAARLARRKKRKGKKRKAKSRRKKAVKRKGRKRKAKVKRKTKRKWSKGAKARQKRVRAARRKAGIKHGDLRKRKGKYKMTKKVKSAMGVVRRILAKRGRRSKVDKKKLASARKVLKAARFATSPVKRRRRRRRRR